MKSNSFWTPEKLARLSAVIDEYERIAFSGQPSASERRKRIRLLLGQCEDDNVRHILGRVLGDLTKDPGGIRRAAKLAREHVALLRCGDP